MRKRGIGALEFIIAFVMFAGFLGTAIYFFNPLKNVSTIENSKRHFEEFFFEETSIEIESYSIKIEQGAGEIVAISIANVPSAKKAAAYGYNGNNLRTKRDHGTGVAYIERQGEERITLVFSDELEESAFSGASTLNSTSYRIASSIKEQMLSEKKILELRDLCAGDYEGLKQRIGIADIDFSFSAEFKDGRRIECARNSPAGKEVFSDSFLKEVLQDNNLHNLATITIKAW